MANKKLIEVALPLEKINAESAREKSIRHGHPSTLHLWWARRPLAAARAVIWSSLVDDPSSHPELFPTEEDQTKERERLFKILEDLVVWENSNNEDVLNEAKAEILKSTNGMPPALLDPFAGGGAIPLEAQRLGLEAHAHDLNPVAVMINKAMIEIPPKFAGQAPVNPDIQAQVGAGEKGWQGAAGLAEDVRYYGEWMKQEAYKRIGHLYPKVNVPQEQGGGEATVIAWIWARTIICQNPACRFEVPLVKTFSLSSYSGREYYSDFCFNDKGEIRFFVKKGRTKTLGTVNRKGAICPHCGAFIPLSYIRQEFSQNHGNKKMMAIIAEGRRKKYYISPSVEQIEIAGSVEFVDDSKLGKLAYYPGYINPVAYGLTEIENLFTQRQFYMLSCFSALVNQAKKKILADSICAGMSDDHINISDGGDGALAYSEAIGVYLSFLVDKLTDYHSSICSWNPSREGLRNTFGMTGMSMSWDFAEANPFSNSSGCISNMINWIIRVIQMLPANKLGIAVQADAQTDDGLRNVIVSTDPPYYNNVPYADFADFFYVWMRKTIGDSYPALFGTMLTPKNEELTADPYLRGGKTAAAEYFESGMLEACKSIYLRASDNYPLTIYYAFKQSETTEDEGEVGTVSTGWETMLSAIIAAGFSINGTWPVRTERTARTRSNGSNALASSIVLVCRKRPEDAPSITRRNLINILRRELRPALQKLQASNIAPVDLAQSAIGPGMGVFSRYKQVLEADGSVMTVRSALKIINEELDLYFNEQVGDMDAASRFCIDLYTQNAFNDIKYGEAEILANAKSTSIPMMAGHGVVYAKAGIVHLIDRPELTTKVDPYESCIWLLTQQLTQAMAEGGVEACARIIVDIYGSNSERAKDLAYRLYTIAERKSWASEAYAYNALVVAWPDIQARAAALREIRPEQLDLFSMGLTTSE